VCLSGEGTAAATARAALCSRASVLDPCSARVGTFTLARRAAGTANPFMTAASYGSVWATAFIWRQIHGMSFMRTTTGAGTPTMDLMKYVTAPARSPRASRSSR
jgi:hypothetical protein